MLEEIAIRRSVRRFSNQMIEPDKVLALVKAGMQAPSAHNQQSWEFVVVDDRATLDTLATKVQYATPLSTAPLGIVILGKQNVVMPEMISIELGACIENILLEATHQGLGAVWLGVLPQPDDTRQQLYQQLCKVDAEHLVYACLAVGYPAADGNKFIDRYDPAKVHYNEFNNPFKIN